VARGGAGRHATLPDVGYRRPPAVTTHKGAVQVDFMPEDPKDRRQIFDFSCFPVSYEVQFWLANAMGKATSPSGPKRTYEAAAGTYRTMSSFAHYLAALNSPPREPSGITGTHFDGWILSIGGITKRRRYVGVLRSTLRHAELLSESLSVRLSTLRTVSAGPTTLNSYSDSEWNAIVSAAKRELRLATARIRRNRLTLATWRADQAVSTAASASDQFGRLLDYVDKYGDVPRYENGVGTREVVRHGGGRSLMTSLMLTPNEAAAAIVLMICTTGQNLSTLDRASCSLTISSDPTDISQSGQLALTKKRRGAAHASMVITLSDRPDPSVGEGTGPEFGLSSSLGVYQTLVELGELARRLSGTDALVTYWSCTGGKGRGVRSGLSKSLLNDWSTAISHRSDNAQQALAIDSRRLRLTFLERTQRPVAQSPTTLVVDYLSRNRTNVSEYQKLIADVLAVEVGKAAKVLQTAEDFVVDGTATDLGSGEFDTALVSCIGNLVSPYTAPGQPCDASFLLCLECPCARVAPHHLPILLAFRDEVRRLGEVMEPLRWAMQFARSLALVESILEEFPRSLVVEAAARVGPEHVRAVVRLTETEPFI
jgi:hypothetical protein